MDWKKTQRAGNRLRWNRPSPTVTCAQAVNRATIIHPSQERLLTVREIARLQSFPDTTEFKGSVTSKYRQIGNAVPVLFARGSAFIVTMY